MCSQNYLDHTFRVSSYDVDIWGYMKPTSVLHICQDVAYMQSDQNGFGFDAILALNMAWVLSRIKMEVDRMPKWRESIRVRSWHKRQSGIFSLRDYIFYDAEENPIIKVTSSWLIINVATRRVSRADRVFGRGEALTLTEYPLDAVEREAERIEIPTQMLSVVGEHRVRYSDLDINRHVNNTKYIEWACDHSPSQMQQEMTLKSLCANFNHEAKYGDVVTLSAASQSDETTMIEGSAEGKNIFVATMLYGKR